MILIILLVLVLAVVFILQFVGNSKQSTYAQFKEDLDAGNIQAVYFNTGYSVNVVKRNTEAASRNNAAKYYDYFFYIGPNMHPVIYELITESNDSLPAGASAVQIGFNNPVQASFWDYLPTLFSIILIVVMFIFMINIFRSQNSQGMSFGKNTARVQQSVKTRFSDVAGAEEEKEELVEIIDFLKNPRKYTELGARIPAGVLLVGPPGTGKTMLARRLPTIMPGLGFEEKLELTRIYSIAGLLSREHPLIDERPFRSPHHTSTPQAIAGGGRNPRPGEITLAHKGVLFLDEMPEFSRASLELLRQPMEDKVIQIARASGTYNFPADFMLCAAMNPCPCGYYPDLNRCTCTAGEIIHYMGKISRPLLDRIDISTEVPPVSFSQLHCGRKGENSAAIRKRVEKVQKIQEERYKDEKINFNGQLKSSLIDKFCPLTDSASRLLARAFEKIAFSARSYHRILKVARTIADMEGEEMIAGHHIGEALSYRAFDKDSVIK